MKGDLKLGHFVEAVSAIPILPKATLQSMLATLPSKGKLVYEEQVSPTTRRAVGDVLLSMHAYRADALAMLAAGYIILAVSVIVSMIVQAWQPLLAIVFVLPLPLVLILCKHRRIKSTLRRMLDVRKSDDFSCDQYLELISCMDWHGIPIRDKKCFVTLC